MNWINDVLLGTSFVVAIGAGGIAGNEYYQKEKEDDKAAEYLFGGSALGLGLMAASYFYNPKGNEIK
jgi:hypothetical protein